MRKRRPKKPPEPRPHRIHLFGDWYWLGKLERGKPPQVREVQALAPTHVGCYPIATEPLTMMALQRKLQRANTARTTVFMDDSDWKSLEKRYGCI